MMFDYSLDLLELAQSLGSATLYEASGYENSALDWQIRPTWEGAAVAGPAYPVACAPADNLGIHLALEQAPAGSVLVVSAGNFVAGYWGEVLTIAAQTAGIKALVIDGGVRDSKAIREHRFPVFSRGISVRGTLKNSVYSVGKAMEMTGTAVKPGDLVVADDDGVIILPQEEAAAILKRGQQREQKEAVIMEQIKQGHSTLELLQLIERRSAV